MGEIGEIASSTKNVEFHTFLIFFHSTHLYYKGFNTLFHFFSKPCCEQRGKQGIGVREQPSPGLIAHEPDPCPPVRDFIPGYHFWLEVGIAIMVRWSCALESG